MNKIMLGLILAMGMVGAAYAQTWTTTTSQEGVVLLHSASLTAAQRETAALDVEATSFLSVFADPADAASITVYVSGDTTGGISATAVDDVSVNTTDNYFNQEIKGIRRIAVRESNPTSATSMAVRVIEVKRAQGNPRFPR